jgi:N-acetylmuramoyl-L-alanine amidase
LTATFPQPRITPMILARSRLRRNRDSIGRLAIGIVFVLSPAIAVFSFVMDREAAKAAWAEGERLHQALSLAPEPSREGYLKCIRAYQQVYFEDPHFGYSPDAVFEAAKLYQEMGEKFGDLSYFRNAARLYRFLCSDYDLSPRCPEALLRLGTISENPLADEQTAQEAYQKLRTRYKSSPAAAILAAKSKSAGTGKPVPMSIPAQAVAPASPSAQMAAPRKAEGITAIKSISIVPNRDYTRVSIVSDGAVHYSKNFLSNPERIYFDISGARLDQSLIYKILNVEDRFLKQVRTAQSQADLVRIVLDLNGTGEIVASDTTETFGITVDLHLKSVTVPGSKPITNPPAPPPPPKEKVAPPPPVTSVETKPPDPAATKSKREVVSQAGIQNPGGAMKNASDAKPASTRPSLPEKPAKETPAGNVIAAPPPAKEVPAPPIPVPAKEVTKSAAPPPGEPPAPPKTAAPTSYGDRTLTRMLGLKIGRIVLDPGHGGQDTGTIGPGGYMEKDLVLDVAKELQKLLQDKLGAQVVLTRTSDTFVSLEDRTIFANNQQADLFVSIHANSSVIRSVSGVETYFLDFARSDSAREVAARENATSDRNIRDLQELIQKIAQADKLQESRELASIMQKNLYGGVRKLIPSTMNRGVRSAPFVVLIGARMPSVLAEISFLSNPRDEKLLRKDSNRQSLAVALFDGIEGYMKSLGSSIALNHVHIN